LDELDQAASVYDGVDADVVLPWIASRLGEKLPSPSQGDREPIVDAYRAVPDRPPAAGRSRLSSEMPVSKHADWAPNPVRVFYSYSHKDERFRDALEAHLTLLRRQRLIDGWHDRRITPGCDWAGDIEAHLHSADLILLLVSQYFLASDFCYSTEMKVALDRHARGEVQVVPIIVRPVDWQSSPIGRLQALPKDGVPVTRWRQRDDAWFDVSVALRALVTQMLRHQAPDS
jgi:hypothetical protein